jgi:hypothetical protein
MNLQPKFKFPPTTEELLNKLDELHKLEPWRTHDYQFFAFSLIAIRTYYKDHDEHSHDLFRVISEDYELFLSEVYKDEDSMESFERQAFERQAFERQANNYFVTLID